MPWDPALADLDQRSPGPCHTVVTSERVDFVVRDATGITGVRLETDWDLGPTDREFARHDDCWRLHLPRPAVDRFEYQFTVRSESGTAWMSDPDNPNTVPNPFGAKSEIRFPEYREPQWLSGAESGALQSIPVQQGALAAAVPVTVWAPDGLAADAVAPLLIAHDGTDMALRGSLLRWATGVAVDRPFRIALLDPAPGHRDDWYAASDSYADHFASVILPAITRAVAVGAIVGLGASLGALSMLTIHRRHPAVFSGLALQSGSFFTATLDPQESGYDRFRHICAAVGDIASGPPTRPVPVLMTCGTVEENRANNEHMARVLAAQGLTVDLRTGPDAHTMIGWRDAWSPGLERLLAAVSEREGSRS